MKPASSSRQIDALFALSALTMAAVLPTAAHGQEGVEVRVMPKANPSAVCGHVAYVTNSYANTLSVIDMRTDRVVANHPTGNGPVNPTFSPDWTRLYLSNVRDSSLTIVDTRSQRIIGTIPAGGAHPAGLRFLPDGKHLVISYLPQKMTDPSSLSLMDLASGKIVWTTTTQARSERFDITPDGKRAYVANLLAQSVTVVDLEKGNVIATIPSPERYPFNVLMSPKGDRAFVGATMSSSIVVIDTATNQVVKTIRTAAGPNGMTFTPDGDNLLITSVYAGRLQAYNLSAGVVSDGTFVGFMPGFIRLTHDGQKGIFVRPYGQKVSIFDGTTLQVTKNIETGLGPSTVAICGNP